jgi:hypothetical protein
MPTSIAGGGLPSGPGSSSAVVEELEGAWAQEPGVKKLAQTGRQMTRGRETWIVLPGGQRPVQRQG